MEELLEKHVAMLWMVVVGWRAWLGRGREAGCRETAKGRRKKGRREHKGVRGANDEHALIPFVRPVSWCAAQN
jgi:hypothetical protein